MNEATAVSDDEDGEDSEKNDIIFDVIINEYDNTKTQFDAQEDVEDEEVRNNNDFFEDGNESNNDELKTPYLQHSNRVRHRPNNLISNMAGERVPYAEGLLKLQV